MNGSVSVHIKFILTNPPDGYKKIDSQVEIPSWCLTELQLPQFLTQYIVANKIYDMINAKQFKLDTWRKSHRHMRYIALQSKDDFKSFERSLKVRSHVSFIAQITKKDKDAAKSKGFSISTKSYNNTSTPEFNFPEFSELPDGLQKIIKKQVRHDIHKELGKVLGGPSLMNDVVESPGFEIKMDAIINKRSTEIEKHLEDKLTDKMMAMVASHMKELQSYYENKVVAMESDSINGVHNFNTNSSSSPLLLESFNNIIGDLNNLNLDRSVNKDLLKEGTDRPALGISNHLRTEEERPLLSGSIDGAGSVGSSQITFQQLPNWVVAEPTEAQTARMTGKVTKNIAEWAGGFFCLSLTFENSGDIAWTPKLFLKLPEIFTDCTLESSDNWFNVAPKDTISFVAILTCTTGSFSDEMKEKIYIQLVTEDGHVIIDNIRIPKAENVKETFIDEQVVKQIVKEEIEDKDDEQVIEKAVKEEIKDEDDVEVIEKDIKEKIKDKDDELVIEKDTEEEIKDTDESLSKKSSSASLVVLPKLPKESPSASVQTLPDVREISPVEKSKDEEILLPDSTETDDIKQKEELADHDTISLKEEGEEEAEISDDWENPLSDSEDDFEML